MLRRVNPPNAYHWNGLGGKIEIGETPIACVQREIIEESNIDLSQASSLFFAGIITWGLHNGNPEKGMYIFLAHLTRDQAEQIHELETPEGLITWKSLTWVCDPENHEVVSNIPHFLPPVLEAKEPYEYFCEYEKADYQGSALRQLLIRPLPYYEDCTPLTTPRSKSTSPNKWR
jgi:8-oxo-dGTP diphosphatase